MHFSTILLAALASLTSAQNPFSFTTLTTVTAGQPFTITWSPSTGTTDTISLVLRQGNSAHLATVLTIASSIQNSGSYVWTPPETLVQGSDYAFEIVDDGNTAIVNYSNEFTIDSTNTVSPVPSATGSTTSPSSASMTSNTQASATTASASASTSGSGSSSANTAAKTSDKSSTSSGSTTSTSAAATASTSAPNSNKNGGNVGAKVGVGMLAVVGAMMAAL